MFSSSVSRTTFTLMISPVLQPFTWLCAITVLKFEASLLSWLILGHAMVKDIYECHLSFRILAVYLIHDIELAQFGAITC